MPISLRRFALLAAVSLPACGLATFTITSPLPSETIPASTAAGLAQLETPVTVGAQSTGPADSAQLAALTFTSADANTFDFLQSVHLFVSSPGLPQVEIANLVAVPLGQTSISLDVIPGVNLLPYLQAGCTLSNTVVGTSPTQDFNFTGQLVAQVGL